MSILNPLTEDFVRHALQAVRDPYLQRSLPEIGALKSIQIENNEILVSLKLGYPLEGCKETLQAAFTQQLKSSLEALGDPFALERVVDFKIEAKLNRHIVQNNLKPVPGVKNIIAVASGKGGVGKSTTAVNLALALKAQGAGVGLLDADIYGPSQPLFLGINEKPIVGEDKRLQPVVKFGLQTMSMGYLVDQDAAMVWRGPMVSSALQQLLFETAWQELDFLVVDLPPGTGDIQLTMAQKIPVSGVVIVTTPEDVALLDAKRAIKMFQKLGISILGIVENMSQHICIHCGHQEAIFGSDGGQALALEYNVPLLGQIPLDLKIREAVGMGHPSVVFDPKGSLADLYSQVARRAAAELSLKPRDNQISCVIS